MNNIAVFCASSIGTQAVFKDQAFALGQKIANEGWTLIYGGAKVGLMGAVADGTLSKNGEVIGVLPNFLGSKEIAHEALTELIMVDTMHERKSIMHERSDAIIMLPGGYGTLEEFFEMLTWAQLGLHEKPIGILNTDGYYDDLLSLVNNMVEKGFLKPINQDMILFDTDIDALIDKMTNYEAPHVKKWISDEAT